MGVRWYCFHSNRAFTVDVAFCKETFIYTPFMEGVSSLKRLLFCAFSTNNNHFVDYFPVAALPQVFYSLPTCSFLNASQWILSFGFVYDSCHSVIPHSVRSSCLHRAGFCQLRHAWLICSRRVSNDLPELLFFSCTSMTICGGCLDFPISLVCQRYIPWRWSRPAFMLFTF